MGRSLEGKVALVTGGSRGIGAAIARRLAADGAAVAITYSSAPDKAETVVAAIISAGGQAIALRADSADPAAVQQAVEDAVGRFGRLDILVNNAGIAQLGPIDDFSLAAFDRSVAVNVRAVFAGAQAAAHHMGEGGRIIAIGSVVADRIPFAGASVYTMTKSAVAGLTRGLARDLGPRGITVNVVQPGPIDTDMNPSDSADAAMLRGLTALGRYGAATEIASLVAYLASPDAAYVTGAALNIDGGLAA